METCTYTKRDESLFSFLFLSVFFTFSYIDSLLFLSLSLSLTLLSIFPLPFPALPDRNVILHRDKIKTVEQQTNKQTKNIKSHLGLV